MKTFLTIFCFLVSLTGFSQTIRYVNQNAGGANNGTSWVNAFTKLQNALAAAASGDQVWVAAGIYYPDEGATQTNDDRFASFILKNNVAIYGGFAGTETQFSERNWQTNTSILSGDLQQNDGNNFTNNGDNALHIVRGESTDNTAVLDGFTITGGNANVGYRFQDGGGGAIKFGGLNVDSPTLTNCSFVKNKAIGGGAVFNDGGSPVVSHCSFSENKADEGGAIYDIGFHSTFTDCIFSKDSANSGGAIYYEASTTSLINCNFSENWAYQGGGIFSDGSNPAMVNCSFSKNSAIGGDGGAIYNANFASPTLTNCSFSENIAQHGGAILNRSSSITANNCSFQDNKGATGGGVIYSDFGSSSWFTNCILLRNFGPLGGAVYGASANTTLTNCTAAGNTAGATGIFHTDQYARLTITNSILWGNTGSEIFIVGNGTATVSYSIVQGGYTGSGNLNEDPLFADAANGSLRLQGCSPAIDAGNNVAVTASTDLDGNTRIIHTTVDMGTYEYNGTLYNFYPDGDGDGYGSKTAGSTRTSFCSTPSPCEAANNTDCDDNNAAINPGATEVCNGIDDDCDGQVDEGVKTTFYRDADSDGYGNPSLTTQACSVPSGYVANNTDCNDSNPGIHPGVEICGNGIDDNCNGQVDENCSSCGNPTGLTTTGITSNSAILNWVASVNPVQWQVEYKTLTTGSKWVTTTLAGSARSLTVTSLIANQKYQWHIRAKCGKQWTSFSDAVTFKTSAGTNKVMARSSNAESLSINGAEEKSSVFKLYPNPSKGQFMIELHLGEKINTTAKFQLIDITGRMVHTENATITNGVLQKKVSISSLLSSGIYTVKIIANDKMYLSKLIYEK